MDTERAPDHYILKTVIFGDEPGGTTAMMALRKTAHLSLKYPLATKIIIKNSYVDDILSSCDNAQEAAERMRQTDGVGIWRFHNETLGSLG